MQGVGWDLQAQAHAHELWRHAWRLHSHLQVQHMHGGWVVIHVLKALQVHLRESHGQGSKGCWVGQPYWGQDVKGTCRLLAWRNMKAGTERSRACWLLTRCPACNQQLPHLQRLPTEQSLDLRVRDMRMQVRRLHGMAT